MRPLSGHVLVHLNAAQDLHSHASRKSKNLFNCKHNSNRLEICSLGFTIKTYNLSVIL
jgi:hypothetical protein